MRRERRWGPVLVAVAALPLIVALCLLELVGPFAGPLAQAELLELRLTLPEHIFVPGALTFLAVAAAHILVCLAAIAMAVDLLRRTPRSFAFTAGGVLVAAGVISGMILVFFSLKSVAAELAYTAYEQFFTRARTPSPFVVRGASGLSPLGFALVLPTGFGIVAVAMMSAAANAQLHLFNRIFDRSAAAQAARIRQLHGRIKHCLYALSVVLVTSTVAASLYFHLPTGYELPKEDTRAAELMGRVSAYAAEMSLFWGFIFSLTLAAAVALPLVLLQQRVQRALEPPFNDRNWPRERKLVDQTGTATPGREQVKFFVTLLAPFLAAPVASFLKTVTFF